jgi:hypothetical protein
MANHTGHFIVGSFGLVGTTIVVWDNHKGRRESVDKVETKIGTLETKIGTEIGGIKDKLNCIEKDVTKVKEDVQGLQAIVLETGYRTMKALGGNNKPMMEWLKRLENCVQSGGKGCR